jgi:SRSO17 transposase
MDSSQDEITVEYGKPMKLALTLQISLINIAARIQQWPEPLDDAAAGIGALAWGGRVLAAVPKAAWERRSCGQGTKGERYYDWAAVAVTVKDQPPADGHIHTLLIRRSVSDPSEIEFFLAHAPDPTPIPELIAVAGMRWKIEENNAQGKDLLGLDQYQVRKWTPWHRHVTTCMLAHAFLAATRANLGKQHPPREVPAR